MIRIKVIVPIAMDEAGIANRAQQLPADFVRPGFAKLKAEALRAIADDGADVIVLGSTTMHQSAAYLAKQLPVPVLNPGQVAYKQLETLIELGLTHSKLAFPAPEVPKFQDVYVCMSGTNVLV